MPEETGEGAHVGVDLGEAGTPDRHRVEPVLKVVDVRRDHHAARSDLVAHGLGPAAGKQRFKVGLSLGDPLHLRRHRAEACVLELRQGCKVNGVEDAEHLAAGGHELCDGLAADTVGAHPGGGDNTVTGIAQSDD